MFLFDLATTHQIKIVNDIIVNQRNITTVQMKVLPTTILPLHLKYKNELRNNL